MMLLALAAVAAIAALASAVPGVPPDHGDWIITKDTEFKGASGYVEQNVMVQGGATLTLEDAVLTINRSLSVQTQGMLVVINSTVAFNCTPAFDNGILVLDNGKVVIRDKDDNWLTPGDRSIITSANTLNFNFTVVQGGSLRLLNSEVRRCGRHLLPVPSVIPEGLIVRADNAEVVGTTFRDCYVGLTMDNISSPMVSNCTFVSCDYGIWARGLTDAAIQDCRFTRSGTDAIFMRGFMRNILIARCSINDSGQAGVDLVYVTGPTGLESAMTDCSIGPGCPWGVLLDNVDSLALTRCSVSGCDVGLEAWNSTVALTGLNVTDCRIGLATSNTIAGKLTIIDLGVVRSRLAVDPSTVGNLTYTGNGTIDGATGTIATFIVVEDGGTLDIASSTLAFRSARGRPTGIVAKARSTLGMRGCTIDSPASGTWVFKLMALSQFTVERCALLHLGYASGTLEERGLYVAGGGSVSDLDVTDSIYGIVAGRTQATFTNVTATRCQSAIYVNGDLGKGGMEVKGLRAVGCGRVATVINNATLTISGSDIDFDGEGLNLSRSVAVVRDSSLHPTTTGQRTASLTQTSTLNLVNSTFADSFLWGASINTVNIYWYLTLTVRVLEPADAPLVNGSVTIHDRQGVTVVQDASTRSTGRLPQLDLRQRSLINGAPLDGTPHTVWVSKDGLSDSFTVTMDRNVEMTFWLDNVPPGIAILAPAPLAAFNVSTVRFNGTASDSVATAHAGIDHMGWRVDNGTWTDFPVSGDGTWALEAVLPDGWRFVEVRAVDRIGNVATVAVTVLVDTQPPSLAIVSPLPPVPPTNKRTLSVLGQTERGATVTVDGAEVPVLASGAFSANVTLAEGPNTVRVVARDALGNVRTVTIDVTLDTVAPVVTLSPTPPERTRDPSTRIAGTKEAGATLTVSVDGTSFTGPEGSTTFDITVPLVNGMTNQISIVSVDPVGNTYHGTVNVTRDSTPPRLTVAQLPASTNHRVVSVQGTVDDPAALVTVNGAQAPVSGATFTTQVDLVEGPNTITIGAVDALGNEATPLVMNITLDTVLPSLRMTTDSHVSVDVDHAPLSGTTDPSMTVRVVVTYGAYSKTYTAVTGPTGAFSFDIEMPQIGNHSVVVTVEDGAGNKAVETLTFERTLPKPVVPPPAESHWLQDNWVYLVLLASIVTSILVLLIIMVPSKRRKEARRRLREANLAAREAREAEAAKTAGAGAARETEEAGEGGEAVDGGDAEGTDEPDQDGEAGEAGGAKAEGDGAPREGGGWEEYEEPGEGSEESDED